jgi:hypothetical protein
MWAREARWQAEKEEENARSIRAEREREERIARYAVEMPTFTEVIRPSWEKPGEKMYSSVLQAENPYWAINIINCALAIFYLSASMVS